MLLSGLPHTIVLHRRPIKIARIIITSILIRHAECMLQLRLAGREVHGRSLIARDIERRDIGEATVRRRETDADLEYMLDKKKEGGDSAGRKRTQGWPSRFSSRTEV